MTRAFPFLLLCLCSSCTEPEPETRPPAAPVLEPSWKDARVGDEVTLSSASGIGEKRVEDLLRLTVVKRTEDKVFLEANLGGTSRLVEVPLTGARRAPLEGQLDRYELPNGQTLPCYRTKGTGRGYHNDTSHCRSAAPPLYLTGGLVEWSSTNLSSKMKVDRAERLRVVALSRGRMARAEPTEVLLFEPTVVTGQGGTLRMVRTEVRQNEVITTECWPAGPSVQASEEWNGQPLYCGSPRSSQLLYAILAALQKA
jgi:hypothetical protein